MLARLRGTIVDLQENETLVASSFFTFRLFSPRTTVTKARVGQEVELHTHLHVRENEISLYGFLEKVELELFEKLIGISGVGPKSALEILALGTEMILDAIQRKDAALLSSAKGIGKKTAERITIELEDKVFGLSSFQSSTKATTLTEEVLSALEGLGWKRADALGELKKLPKELETAEEMVRWFLTNR